MQQSVPPPAYHDRRAPNGAGQWPGVVGIATFEAQLYGVTRVDPAVYAAAASLAVVVLLAGLWPDRTAARIEPVEALRVE